MNTPQVFSDQLLDAADYQISLGKTSLLRTSATAFYAVIVLSLNIRLSDKVPTAGVNRNLDMHINPQRLIESKLTREEVTFLLVHEILHIVYSHVLASRIGNRDHRLWNVAADYVINNELKEAGFHVIDGALLNPKYNGMTTEEVYTILEDEGNTQQPDHSDLMPSDSDGDDSDTNGNDIQGAEAAAASDKESDEHAESKIRDLVMTAYNAHKMSSTNKEAGKLPASIERLIEQWLNPTLPWQKLLEKFFNETQRDDFSWRKPNKRMFSLGYILPTLHSEGLQRVDFAVDVSGSICEAEFRVFLSELAGVIRKFKPKEVGVMQFDTHTRTNTLVRNLNDLSKIPYAGGGGTCIADTLNEFKKSPAKALIVFTDGYLNTQLPRPSRPVIWCIYDNPSFKAPFGQVVHFNLKDLKNMHG